ncbi:uncharacterized protein N7459_002598 [Penicillium hispanicum]|uniref:uncharacterized protein n=1 Tax=Penicillium hispanicum TaxID=1080232 RepID=UPI002542097C|nr:uncharacterized protein N7459_002598 [Penicillium hispanicum]KAJ5586833.1 hypothetical protein N7459_002598 [Penicillium hispanicum]
MGGAPYRSKGCNTCLRRKVKCDETKPECMRCLKNSHVCTGYERSRIFILNSTEDTRALARRPREPPKGQAKIGDASSSTATKPAPDIPRFDVNPTIRTQFIANFIDCFVPSAAVRGGKGDAATHLQETFPVFIGTSPILDKAVTALSSAFFAKRNHDYQLLRHSTRLYAESLQIVHRRIRMGRKCGQDSLFATVVFQLYELINSSPLGFKAWLAHVQGSNAILSQYDSLNPSNVMEHLFCRQLKFVTVCDAIRMRKSAFSYSPFWRNPPSESPWCEPIDTILDSLLKCSAFMERIDHLVQHGKPSLHPYRDKGEQLLSCCLALKGQIEHGFCKMQTKMGVPWSAPYQSSFWSELDHSIPGNLFSDSIEFPSLSCAESHLLYWTTFILLCQLIDELLIFLNRTRNNLAFTLWDVPLSDTEGRSYATLITEFPDNLMDVAEHYANLICRSAKFLVQLETKALGAQILLAPFSQATQFYHSQEATEKHKWCQAVFTLFAKLGFGIAPFLKDMIWPKYEAATVKRLNSTSSEASSDQPLS